MSAQYAGGAGGLELSPLGTVINVLIRKVASFQGWIVEQFEVATIQEWPRFWVLLIKAYGTI